MHMAFRFKTTTIPFSPSSEHVICMCSVYCNSISNIVHYSQYITTLIRIHLEEKEMKVYLCVIDWLADWLLGTTIKATHMWCIVSNSSELQQEAFKHAKGFMKQLQTHLRLKICPRNQQCRTSQSNWQWCHEFWLECHTEFYEESRKRFFPKTN